MLEYNGAIKDQCGLYQYHVFPLIEQEEVLFGARGTKCSILIEDFTMQECVSVRYDKNRMEYWVQASQKGLVYLDSGQPLGKDRRYYLPRGSYIYIKTKQNKFQLG